MVYRYQILAQTNSFDSLDQIYLVFQVKNGKTEHHHWIPHNQTSVCIKFHFKQTILNFGTKFTQKEYFWSKLEKVNIITEFCIFELI